MHIFVGSRNPVKINAVVGAASETWPEVEVTGVAVPSGVSEQPWGDSETKQGSLNRAQEALKAGQIQVDDFDQLLGVGLEGGVLEVGDELWSTVWVTVVCPDDIVKSANGARFKIPQVVATKMRQGAEMGPLVAEMVEVEDVRSKQGFIGVMTNNFIDRTEEYQSITKMALGLWYGHDHVNQVLHQTSRG